MAVTQTTFTRGGRDYIAYKGKDDTGQFVEYIEEVEKYINDLTGRFFPKTKTIEHKPGNGNVAFILTTFQWALFADNGEMITDPKNDHPLFGTLSVRTNPSDQADFTAMFEGPVSRFDINGFVRSVMGFDNLRVFNSQTGATINYTPEQLAEPATYTYNG